MSNELQILNQNSIVAAFLKSGISEDQAKSIIAMIAKNEVPHVSIKY